MTANDQLMPEFDVGYYTFSVELVPSEGGLPPGNWTLEFRA